MTHTLFFGPKNCGSKFCTMNAANSIWKLQQWLIRKTSCLGQMGHLRPRVVHPASQLWIRCEDCFTILHNETGQERHGNFNNGFSENLFQSNLVILEQKWYGVLLTLNLLRFFLLILHNERDQKVRENFISCFFEEKSHWGQFELFRSFSVWVGVVKIEPGHSEYWIFKHAGHDFFRDCYWILKQSGHD